MPSSFHHPELTRFKALRPEIRLGALTASLPLHGARFAEELGAWSLNCDVDFVDAGAVHGLERWLDSHPSLDERVQRIYGRRMPPLPLTPVNEAPEPAPRAGTVAPGAVSLASLVDPFSRL